MAESNSYRVIVKNRKDPKDIHVIGTGMSAARADRVRDGVRINLNHAEFYVIVEKE
jgi:hypothetical protein